MTSGLRLSLGIASALPAAFLLSFMTLHLSGRLDPAATGLVTFLVAVGLTAMLCGLASIGFFAMHTVKATDRGQAWKLGWIISLSMVGILAAPAYWFSYIRRTQ